MKGKSGIKDAVFQWAYQNRRQKTKTSEVLRSIEEVENIYTLYASLLLKLL